MDHFVDLSNFSNIFSVIFKMVEVHELVHGRAGLGNVELVGILAGHNDFLLLFECLVGFVAFGYRKHSFAGFFVGMQSERR